MKARSKIRLLNYGKLKQVRVGDLKIFYQKVYSVNGTLFQKQGNYVVDLGISCNLYISKFPARKKGETDNKYNSKLTKWQEEKEIRDGKG
ncbi:MAG: hypothetical protein IPH52_18865 [Leptospiraceae bacterium]|nr:hypothetical protein [Leptospiraceae bacterium]